MLNWFGPIAPRHDILPRCDPPVGSPCARCARLIVETDQGVTLPLVQAEGTIGVAVYHHGCFLKGITPHASWPTAGFVPDVGDGFEPTSVIGEVRCTCCGVTYSFLSRTWR